ncbi:gamma-glutamyltranspeptidase [compost metagenome]
MSMQDAVDAGRVHFQWFPDTIQYEKKAIDSVVVEKLKTKGYNFKVRTAIGRTDAILKTRWGYYTSGADKRGDDAALGW